MSGLFFNVEKAIDSFENRTVLEEDDFESGLCAAFALSLVKHANSHGANGYVSVLMRVSVDASSGEEHSRTFSHCVACFDDGIYDFSGKCADERWISKFPEDPDEDDLVNDWECLDFKLDQIEKFKKLCEDFCVSLNEVPFFESLYLH